MYRGLKEDGKEINMVDLAESQAGWKGSEFISDTAAHTTTNVFTALQVISDAIISAYTTDTGALITGNTLTGNILTVGTVIYGRFKSVTLTSGKIMAYKGL